MRSLATALAAGIASQLTPAALALWVFLEGPGVDAAGSPDDAPYRAAASLLMLIPVSLLVASVYFAAAARLLGRLRKVDLGSMMALSGIVSAGVAAFFAIDGHEFGGMRDAAISFVAFGTICFSALAIGSLAWWFARPRAEAQP